MSNSWDDFRQFPVDQDKLKCRNKNKHRDEEDCEKGEKEGCDWGFSRRESGKTGDGEGSANISDTCKFISIYEKYLQDKSSIKSQTKNYSMYGNNPQKAIKEWFENEGHEFNVKTDQPREGQYICILELPVDDQDFTLTSELYGKKQNALDEICMAACKMLDECQLLYAWNLDSKEDSDMKRKFNEANKEDDIELDKTHSKRHCETSSISKTPSITSKVNTYDSLMAKWNELNMSILKLKAELVKLDLSVSKPSSKNVKPIEIRPENDDDEVDPLDEYMSSLETKTKLSMDEKIERSRIKSQIVSCEREQNEVSRLIEIAKPSFDLNKTRPPGSVKSSK